MLWILVLLICVALTYLYIIKPHSYWRSIGVKQGNPAFFFGENWGTITRTQSFSEMILHVYNMFPDSRYTGFYQFLMPTLLLRDSDLIKQLTVKDFDNFMDHRSIIPEEVDPLLGKNLFSLKGQKWRDMRATLSPSFTSSKMKAMFTLISDCARDFVEHFKQNQKDIITIEMKDTFTRFTNDVIATTAFGIKVDSLKNRNNQFYVMGKEMTNFSSFWKNMKFFGYFACPRLFELMNIKIFTTEISTFFKSLIMETIKTREEKGIVRQDMINILMEARKGLLNYEENNGDIDTGFATVEESDIGKSKKSFTLTDDDVTAQALIFFFAGFDTVSTLMCFMSYELGVNQEIQDKLREEINETLNDCGGKLTYEALMKMKYLDMVLSESLRKWPSAAGVDRVCTKPYTISPVLPDEKPLHLKKNDILFLPIFGIHRDPKNYPNPEKFDPERFNDDNKGSIKPYTYLPFGTGPRNCIGSRFAIMETKAVFFHILANFKIVPVEKTVIPLKICKKNFNLTSENGFWLGLQRI
ncbi:cytochrome P450 9e2-like isoform X3 [Aethina tumida]|uniref:cytochrome P450 9e2-like isoform X3 n=1 Tax=Aethina tumida TaxID=116153 RepID=UPI00096B413B|nr:cytochrome P450 9e2-like isoform X3 [Aethina tumida]